MTGIYHLQGVVKHYDWGGYDYIPRLLNQFNDEKRPFAEYWMGTHPLGNGIVEIDEKNRVELQDITGNLSYLLKVLDVRDMLSIQVHPSKEAAVVEFAKETAAGIPLDAPQRNYKDANHKPELMVALNEFWLLHGFKPQEELVYTLLNVVELRELLAVFNSSGYAGLYKYVMEMPQAEVNRILQPLLDNMASIYETDSPDKSDEDFWVQRAAATYNKNGNIDRGIFSIYLFNLVELKPGQAIYQAAGVPHAYLEGQNVEIMANSDNVLRGGLTTKHIDVPELLKHVKCEPLHPDIQGYDVAEGEFFSCRVPVPDFALRMIRLLKGQTKTFSCHQPEIVLLTNGEAAFTAGSTSVTLRSGSPAAVATEGAAVTIMALEDCTLFMAAGE